MATDWKQIDEKLIRRGELILELGFVEGYREELGAMNRGKEGRPYRLSRTYIQFLTAVRYLYRMPYRQLEGFTRALHRLVPQLPPGDYSRPSIFISEPDDLDTVSGTVRITAAVSGGTISNVKYKIADVGTFDYEGSWVSMSKSGSDYIADWNTLEVSDDDYYITVRAETNNHIYGYDFVRVTTQND